MPGVGQMQQGGGMMGRPGGGIGGGMGMGMPGGMPGGGQMQQGGMGMGSMSGGGPRTSRVVPLVPPPAKRGGSVTGSFSSCSLPLRASL